MDTARKPGPTNKRKEGRAPVSEEQWCEKGWWGRGNLGKGVILRIVMRWVRSRDMFLELLREQ
jgi:hypothetical protein